MNDILIAGALVHSGLGDGPREADIAIRDGRVAAIVDRASPEASSLAARERIDARGLHASPGFIDVHTHYDLALGWPRLTEHLLRQGITSVVGGNCGIGHDDVRKVLDEARAAKLGVNVGMLASYGPIRSRVVARGEGRGATAEEARAVAREVAAELDAGALGLSWGPYHANALASTDELVVATSALRGRPFVIHRRDEGANALAATDEAIAIARAANCPLHVSHLKIAGRMNWPRFFDLLGTIEKARRELDLTTDVYPYDGSLTYLAAILPQGMKADGRLLERLAVPEKRREALEAAHRWFVERQPADRIVLVAPSHPGAPRGGTLVDAARTFGVEDPAEAALIIIERDGTGGWATYRDMMRAEHVETALSLPGCAIASDAVPEDDGEPAAHPRCYGTFARALERARARGELPRAIAQATSIPAARFGLRRGVLREGEVADIVLFEDGIADRASYATPAVYPAGIREVLVAGRRGPDRRGEILTG